MNNLKLIECCLCCNARRFDCKNLDAGKYGGLDYVASIKRNVQDIENKLKETEIRK